MENKDYQIKYDYYRAEIEKKLSSAVCFDSAVGQAMRYATERGKRVRGVAVLAMCDMLQADREDGLNAAAAIECIHAYSLIHDDLPCMDNDDFRRGLPSCHKKFGETTALLAGDALLTFAFELAAKIENPASSREAAKALAESAGAAGMVLGQELDLSETRPSSVAELDRLHGYKTGKLFECCARLACACAGKGKVDVLTRFMREIGLVFQIVDDLLDVTSNQEVLGKPINSDQKNGKITYISFITPEECRALALKKTADAVALIERECSGCEFMTAFARSLAARVM